MEIQDEEIQKQVDNDMRPLMEQIEKIFSSYYLDDLLDEKKHEVRCMYCYGEMFVRSRDSKHYGEMIKCHVCQGTGHMEFDKKEFVAMLRQLSTVTEHVEEYLQG